MFNFHQISAIESFMNKYLILLIFFTPASKAMHLCEKWMYPQIVPAYSKIVVNDYPKVGKAVAYRFPKADNYFARPLRANKDGIIQIPGLPPIYERTIRGRVYVDLPHLDVFNAYIGRHFFVPYTTVTQDLIIPEAIFWRIISFDQYPIAITTSEISGLTHDQLGHGIVMAVMHDHPAWKKTVDIVNRIFAVEDEVKKSNLSRTEKRKFLERAKYMFLYLNVWEAASVNTNEIRFAQTRAQLNRAIEETEQLLNRSLIPGEQKLKQLEADLRRRFSNGS